MNEGAHKKTYDLEERTLRYSKDIRRFVFMLPKTDSNREDIRQLIRSSGSVGANYIEANESLGKKDFLMKIKISKKEAKESNYWLKLLNLGTNEDIISEHRRLLNESMELMKIFGSIATKSI